MRQGWWHQLLRRPHRALAWPCFHCLGFSLATPVPPAPSHGFSPRSQPAAAPRARPGLRPKRRCQFPSALARPQFGSRRRRAACRPPARAGIAGRPLAAGPPSSARWNRGLAVQRLGHSPRHFTIALNGASLSLSMALLGLSRHTLLGTAWSLSIKRIKRCGLSAPRSNSDPPACQRAPSTNPLRLGSPHWHLHLSEASVLHVVIIGAVIHLTGTGPSTSVGHGLLPTLLLPSRQPSLFSLAHLSSSLSPTTLPTFPPACLPPASEQSSHQPKPPQGHASRQPPARSSPIHVRPGERTEGDRQARGLPSSSLRGAFPRGQLMRQLGWYSPGDAVLPWLSTFSVMSSSSSCSRCSRF